MSDAVLDVLARAFAGARGNDRFPRTRPLAALTTAWSQALALSPSSVPAPTIDPESGMVPWLTWAALLAERDLGKGLTPSSTPPSSEAQLKLWKRETAAKKLAEAPPLSLLDVEVAVRRVEPARALLTLVLDRASAEGLFVRVSVDAWVAVKGEASADEKAKASAALQDVLSLASALPAPALLVRASTLPGVVVERLARGVVGPALHAAGGPSARHGIEVLGGEFGLIVSSEELALDIAATVDNDAFADDDLDAIVQALPKKIGAFKAFRDAKVVATKTLVAQVKALAAKKQTKTVVHELR